MKKPAGETEAFGWYDDEKGVLANIRAKEALRDLRKQRRKAYQDGDLVELGRIDRAIEEIERRLVKEAWA